MERRNTVTDTLYFRVGKSVRYNTYKVNLLWKDVIETEGPLPTDTYGGISFQDEKQSGFGMSDDEPETFEVAKIKVYRDRPENDKEYFDRMKRSAEHEKENTEKERLEYLRLKAKFEDGTSK